MKCSLRVLRGWGALSLCWAVLSWCPPAAASGIDPTQLRPDGTIDWGSETIVRIEEDWLRRIGPAHFSHINFRGTFRFNVERYADVLVERAAGRGAAKLGR